MVSQPRMGHVMQNRPHIGMYPLRQAYCDLTSQRCRVTVVMDSFIQNFTLVHHTHVSNNEITPTNLLHTHNNHQCTSSFPVPSSPPPPPRAPTLPRHILHTLSTMRITPTVRMLLSRLVVFVVLSSLGRRLVRGPLAEVIF